MSELNKNVVEEPVIEALEQITAKDEEIFYASQGQLIVWRFRRHKLAMFSLIMLIIMYIIAAVPGFFAPYGKDERFKKYSYAPPSTIRFFAPLTAAFNSSNGNGRQRRSFT